MRKQLLRMAALCAACLVIGAQAQTTPDPNTSSGGSSSPGSSSGSSPSDSSKYSGSQSGWTSGHMSGRMSHQELRASQLTGAQVADSSGTSLGTISDVIINPGLGRIDFAVLSLSSTGSSSTGSATSPGGTSSTDTTSPGSSSSTSSAGGATSPGGTSSTTSGALGTSSAIGGKQVAVPWALLRPSMSGTSTSTSTGQQPSFTFSGESSKLQSAPTFDATTDLSQPGWRHSVFSYFGLTGSSGATGGAETPGGSSGSSSGTTTPQQQ